MYTSNPKNSGYEELPKDLPRELPVFASNELVPFPGVLLSSEISLAYETEPVRLAVNGSGLLFLASFPVQESQPTTENLLPIGVLGRIVRYLDLGVGRKKLLVQGIVRARIEALRQDDYLMMARFGVINEPLPMSENRAISEVVKGIVQYVQILVEREYLPEEMLLVSDEMDNPGRLADIIIAQLSQDVAQSQTALLELDLFTRLQKASSIIADTCNQVLVAESVQERVKERLQKGQREFYLREQIRQIQVELGNGDAYADEVRGLRELMEEIKFPEDVAQEAFKQLKRLESMPAEAGEFSLLHTYLDWICEIPWGKKTRDKLDPKRAKRILDRDHYGLKRVKERILEYLCVRRLHRDARGPILCFLGPPGVGKTSLGRSVAAALGKKYFRISLGGLRDEAEIRGHRRTYLGAMPGRIVQALKTAGSMNPVIVLDEIDKIGNDFRGDPASALLEVLDPHQNKEFRDHYLNLDIDLSGVLFVATANTADGIPDALLDRLEIISVPGYTLAEKLKIAKLFVVPRQLQENGLEGQGVSFTAASLTFLVERYTEEAGVRNLEREIAGLCRKIARSFVEDGKVVKSVTPRVVQSLLGPTRYDPELSERQDAVGLAMGLAWTINGGELMPVEAAVSSGTGVLTLTGQLGNIMQESAQAAVSFARASARQLKIDPDWYASTDVHIHVPAGATPKDGPSAGITIVTALVSALTKRPVSCRVAMTGEMTLRGNVLSVGGLREKILAAQRAGLESIILPKGNEKDLVDISRSQLKGIEIVFVSHVTEVLEMAIVGSRGGRRSRV
jgi:ATP-dependent Lon protease